MTFFMARSLSYLLYPKHLALHWHLDFIKRFSLEPNFCIQMRLSDSSITLGVKVDGLWNLTIFDFSGVHSSVFKYDFKGSSFVVHSIGVWFRVLYSVWFVLILGAFNAYMVLVLHTSPCTDLCLLVLLA